MVGLGCGARSYTRTPALLARLRGQPKGVKGIIADYLARSRDELRDRRPRLRTRPRRAAAPLPAPIAPERRRAGRGRATPPLRHRRRPTTSPNLRTSRTSGLLAFDSGRWSPTPLGLERSDALGPWFFSPRVRTLMAEYEAEMNLSILYRGPLSSCNYACDYCPFAKRPETPDRTRARPRVPGAVRRLGARSRFGRASACCSRRGARRWSARGIRTRSRHSRECRTWRRPRSRRTSRASSTGSSVRQDRSSRCGVRFTRRETTRDRFLAKCRELIARGVRFSVGVVGLKEHLAEIAALAPRTAAGRVPLGERVQARTGLLHAGDDRRPDAHRPAVPAQQPAITRAAATPCRAGASAISVDGDGTMRRCHFIKEPIGNIYDAEFRIMPA